MVYVSRSRGEAIRHSPAADKPQARACRDDQSPLPHRDHRHGARGEAQTLDQLPILRVAQEHWKSTRPLQAA